MRIYLAGPMKGVPGFNYPAFGAARTDLRRWGHEVRCPAEHDVDRKVGADDFLEDTATAFECFRWDLEAVLWAELVVALPGWQKSAGAMLETQVAAAIGTPVMLWPEWEPVVWHKRPTGAPVLPRRIPVSVSS